MEHLPFVTRYLIDSLFTRHQQCIGVVIASEDGMVIDSRLPADVDRTALAAVIAGWNAALSHHSTPGLDAGVVRINTGQIVLTRLSDGNVLGILVEHGCPTGRILLDVLDTRVKTA